MNDRHIFRALASIGLLTLLLSACRSTVVVPQPIASAAPSASPIEPSATSQAVQPSAAAREASALTYYWPNPLPTGMGIDPPGSSADETGFTLALVDPSNAQNQAWIQGGTAARKPPASAGEAIMVRGQAGVTFTTGAGYAVYWEEQGQPYAVGGFLLSADGAIEIAETLEPLNLRAWQGRLGGTPSGVRSTDFQCSGDATADGQAVMLIEPFCVVWRDSYSDESGYRIEIGYYSSGEQFVYHAPANQTEYRVPEQDTPTAAASCSARSSFTISVYVQRPSGEELVGGMGMDGECGNVGASASAAGNAGHGPLGQDRLRICVAAADGPPKPGVIDTIRNVLLQTVALRDDFVQMNTAYFDGNEPSLEEGCPGPMTILSPEWTYAGGKGGAPYRVDAPSPYFLWIWIAKAQDVQQAFGDDFPRRTSQEHTCAGDACNEANSAIYLTPDDLNDPERIAQSLAWGLGFQQ